MEYKQEPSQSKPPTKSYRRRQRRKEAAALQKLATSVISTKIESSVEFLEKLSVENINNVNKNPVENLKKGDKTAQNQPSQQKIGSKSNQVPANISEGQKNEHVIQKKRSNDSEVTNILCSNLGSNKIKVSIADNRSAQGKNVNNEERKSFTEASKADGDIPSHEPCPSVKACCTPKKLNKKNNKNSSHLIPKNSVSVLEGDINSNSNIVGFKNSGVGEESVLKKKEVDITNVGNEVKVKGKCASDNLNRKKGNQLSENLETTPVVKDLQKKEHPQKTTKSMYSGGKTEKTEDVLNTSDDSSVDEEQNQSDFVFQQTGIYSFHTSQTHLGIKLKEPSAITGSSSSKEVVKPSGNEMNKLTKTVSGQECALSKEVHGDTCVSEVADKMEKCSVKAEVADKMEKCSVKVEVADKMEKCSVKAESEKEASERDQVKAEREARKMAKLLKKQKDKVPPVVKESGAANAQPTPEVPSVGNTGEKNSGTPNKTDSSITPTQGSESNKSKAELRAERRAKQEAQRAAKAEAAPTAVTIPSQKKATVAETNNASQAHPRKGVGLKRAPVKIVRRQQGAKLLSRLGLEESRSQDWRQNTLLDTSSIHPAIVQLGTRFTDRIISGSNARCIAFVQAIKKAIQDYQTPPQKELARDLEARLLTPSLEYLEAQRPHAVSVSNATRFLKWQLTQLQPHQHNPSEKKVALPDETAKLSLIDGLDSYIWEKIEVAERAVCLTLRDKIKNGDVILTYGCSYLLQQIFIGAKKAGTMFKVVVVDGRPWKEGREMLRCLVSVGIPCSYVLLSAASSVMRQVNKVILGAHALLSNGYVMSRVGVSQVALLASAHNVPVLVACETHKFCERVQSDSFVYNEMGEPDGLAQLLGGEDGPLSGWRNFPSLSLLNLSYDVTPPELVTAVATELAVLPCTSVPVVLRVRPMEPVTSRH